jgi:membrane-associated phospholipid phosphatase
LCLASDSMTTTSTPDQRAGRIDDPTVEPAPPEGWRRWARELGHYDQDRVAEFGGIIIGAAVLGVVLLYLFVRVADEVLGLQTVALDSAAYQLVSRFRSPETDIAAVVLSLLGSEAVLLFSVLLLGLFLWQRRWGAAVMLVLISGGVQLLNDILKTMFHRTRPEPVTGFIAAQDYSFPSGHAMVSAAFYSYLAYLVWRLVPGAWRYVMIAGLVVLALLIGASRVYLQAHYFTDVIAGWLAGFVWAEAVIIGSQLLVSRRWPTLRKRPSRPAHTVNG